MDFGFGDIRELAKLLNNGEAEYDSDSDDETGKKTSAKIGPGSVGPPKQTGDGQGNQSDNKAPEKNPKEIWDQQEINTVSNVITRSIEHDPRQRPTFETFYRQAVSTEDVYLQMGMKTPCTASCENLVVVINLPGENFQQVKLDIKPDFVFLRSPKYIFRFPTPHPVDPNGGNAKWDQDEEKLTVTLKLAREYDALNF
ncbi:unnamed protein product [Allacma fusca]|uniref:PIH1D1/2/3 CS-like domain-containing protein n=1 Tax=Allacma fusca TaxID=39272 RepID=A0A8J2KM82_9HEXA|nr:unnamed protein product [Allacma fusca]